MELKHEGMILSERWGPEKLFRKPQRPSDAEVEEHYARNHVPFRNLCKHCIMGRIKNSPHTKVKGPEGDRVSVVSINYGFMTTPK